MSVQPFFQYEATDKGLDFYCSLVPQLFMENVLKKYLDVKQCSIKEFSGVHYLINTHVFLQLVPPPCTLDNSGSSSLIPEIQKSGAEEGQVTCDHLCENKLHVNG